jgi:phosphate transport system substrate-binding protein
MVAYYNEGVAQRIKISQGSIGSVEYGFARRLGLRMAWLENKAGEFVAPSAARGQAALAGTSDQMPPDTRLFIPDPDGEGAYPIVS